METLNFPVKKVLVGNKADLEEFRVVSKSRGNSLASLNRTEFFETSAKTNQNVNEIFNGRHESHIS